MLKRDTHTLCTSIKLKLYGDNETIITYPRDNAEHWSQRQWVRWTFGIITNSLIVSKLSMIISPIFRSMIQDEFVQMKTRSVTFSAGMGRNDGSVLWGPGSGYCHSWHSWHRDTAPGTRSYFSWRPPSQIPQINIHPLFHFTVCLSCHCIQSLIDWGRAKELTRWQK